MNLLSISRGVLVFLLGLVLVFIGITLTRSVEITIAVALVYLAAINVANSAGRQ